MPRHQTRFALYTLATMTAAIHFVFLFELALNPCALVESQELRTIQTTRKNSDRGVPLLWYVLDGVHLQGSVKVVDQCKECRHSWPVERSPPFCHHRRSVRFATKFVFIATAVNLWLCLQRQSLQHESHLLFANYLWHFHIQGIDDVHMHLSTWLTLGIYYYPEGPETTTERFGVM